MGLGDVRSRAVQRRGRWQGSPEPVSRASRRWLNPSDAPLATPAEPSDAACGSLANSQGNLGGGQGVGLGLGEEGRIELFEMKGRVRRLEHEVGVWKERYHSASELVAFYERGGSFS